VGRAPSPAAFEVGFWFEVLVRGDPANEAWPSNINFNSGGLGRPPHTAKDIDCAVEERPFQGRVLDAFDLGLQAQWRHGG